MSPYKIVFLFISQLFGSGVVLGQFIPTWDSIDSRTLPEWYDEAKVGIFIHWGVFSVPSFSSEWFWNAWHSGNPKVVDFMNKNYPPGFTYADFAPLFKAEFFDPNRWAEIFKASGAKYIVLTSKHHEGYTMWPSKVSWNWNAMDVGPKRDLVGDLAAAIRSKGGLHFGLYHSMMDWFHPKYLQDKANNWRTNSFPRDKALPELIEIVNAYKPDVIWSDGDWEAPDTYWNSTSFLAWLYNESPVKDTVVVNDRWGIGASCKHGGYYTCSDRYSPGVLQKHKWENCMTIDSSSWGYRRNAGYKDYLKIEDLLSQLASTVSCGGNILINVGPSSDGMISPIFEERLTQLGEWLNVNGEAIYASKPWTAQNDSLTSGVWYTSKKADGATSVYAITLFWPKDGNLTLGSVNFDSVKSVSLLGYQGKVTLKSVITGGVYVILPPIPDGLMHSKWAWVIKFSTV